ncbi:nuclear transport factor 2 family protein [Benzoatithermus flavus]|uniref:Nuclear transport factor 2 family protein n=1 Tax=Benzoatithermus flavus TaxID=3108223 RepID=A0ABU8XXS9_9PROT
MADTTAAAELTLLDALFDAFNRHDVDGIMAFFADDCVFDAAAGPEAHGMRHMGRDAVSAAFAQVWATFPDARWADTRHTIADDLGVSEWTFIGTCVDGVRIEVEGCDLFTFRNGRIVRKRAFRKQRPLLAPDRR